MSKNKLTFAIDFDGCLTEYSFPDIGIQSNEQKELLNVLLKLKEQGHKLILWTSRGEPALQEAIEWCIDHKFRVKKKNNRIFKGLSMIKDEMMGTWCVIPSPEVTSIICKAGFDFVIVDMEHGSMDYTLAQRMVTSAQEMMNLTFFVH